MAIIMYHKQNKIAINKIQKWKERSVGSGKDDRRRKEGTVGPREIRGLCSVQGGGRA